jgi:hypothetical protein
MRIAQVGGNRLGRRLLMFGDAKRTRGRGKSYAMWHGQHPISGFSQLDPLVADTADIEEARV